MATLDEEVRACNLHGITLAQQGRLEEAAGWFRRAVDLKPDAAGHTNLGNVLSMQGQLAEAVACYRAALNLAPENSITWNNLSDALRRLGELDEAVACGWRAVSLQPAYAEAHSNLAIALEARGDREAAHSHCQQAVRLRPDFPEAHNNLGMILTELGRYDEAVASCQEALRLRPDFAEAHNNLGTALLKQDRFDGAAWCFRQALQLRPDLVKAQINLAECSRHLSVVRGPSSVEQGTTDEGQGTKPGLADAHNDRGIALAAQGNLIEAAASYRQALQLKPDFPEALNNLGVVLKDQGKSAEAVASYRHALQLRPDFAEVHNNLGVALADQGKLEDAVASYREALRLKPDFAEALNNLGNSLGDLGKLDEAVASLQHALRLKPAYAEAHNNLGSALREQGKLSEAVASFQQALRRRPDYVEAFSNLGVAYTDQGNSEEAVASFHQALRLRPNYAEAHNNLAIALADQGKVAETLAALQQALRLQPNYADAHKNLAMTLILIGNFEQGWQEYEWRGQCKGFSLPRFAQPLWDGSPLHGRTILLHAEQGLGDTVQFVRYAALVKECGGNVVLACQPALVRLLARCPGIDRLVSQAEPVPPFDVHAPLMSLPAIVRTTSASIPAKVPYIFADADLVERWQDEMTKQTGFTTHHPPLTTHHSPLTKIGIAWQGNPKYRGDRLRSIPLVQFEPLSQLQGVRLFSLQKGPGVEQLEALAGRFPITDLGSRLDEDSGPFMDTAAVIKNLDLVVTSDTAVAHLAGALGVPVWIALPFAPDWRWLLHREDSPWYPTMRLFRQAERGKWQEVFARIAAAVKMILSAKGLPLDDLGDDQALAPEPAATSFNPQPTATDLATPATVAEVRACNLRGIELAQQGRLEESAVCFRRALQLKPDASAHTNLGNILTLQGELAQAVACYRSALKLSPQSAPTWNNLCNALRQLAEQSSPHAPREELLDEAVTCGRRALSLQSAYAEAHSNLGIALEARGELNEALAHCRQAVQLPADFPEAHNNLAIVLTQLGRFDEAAASYQQVLRLNPRDPGAHTHLGMIRLLSGNFERGWPEFEWRLRSQEVSLPSFQQPSWDGSPLKGRTILLFVEHGLGDALQFIRYAPLVKERGGQVVLACPPALVRLLGSGAGIDRLVAQGGALPHFDVYAPLMSLPGILGTTLASIPALVPYLFADADLVERWRQQLTSFPGFKIGIAWQGNPKYRGDHYRSIPLGRFAPLARLEGVRLFSLQKGPGCEQLDALAGQFPVTDLGRQLDESSGAFVDTAAVMKNLDLVVTSDTAMAHLAGALGVPVWVALPFAPDWRWLLHREDSPWYPTMRLFRQVEQGNWEPVFARIAEAVEKLASSTQQSAVSSQQSAVSTQQSAVSNQQPVEVEIRTQITESGAWAMWGPEALGVAPGLAEAHNDRGIALAAEGKLAEAVACYRQALLLKPDLVEVHNNLGIALKDQGKTVEAVASYRQALRLKPDFAEAHNNLGAALADQGKLAEAVACYRQALRFKPSLAEAHNNLGNALGDLGKPEEALACYQRAIFLKPDYAEAHNNLGMTWLAMGNFEQGWPKFEWRLKYKEVALPSFRQPRWDGSPLDARTILLHVEQGLGDTLQFIRYASLVKERGGRVLVACQPGLRPLLASCPGIDQLVSRDGSLPPYDVYAPLLSLPGILGTTLASIPAKVPYLFADANLVERWRRELAKYPGFKIGIAWQGNPNYRGDRFRSIPLAEFAPLARLGQRLDTWKVLTEADPRARELRLEGACLFSLQKGPGTEQLRELAGRFPVIGLGSQFDEAAGAFMDTAAVMKNLDLVVTSDSAVAHLAGALGVPVWVALPLAPDWRWLLERDDSPWYPTMRLFRQAEQGQWEDVFARIAGAAKKLLTTTTSKLLVATKTGGGPIRVQIAPGELIDKITILDIKSERLTDAGKLKNVAVELAVLRAAQDRTVEPSEKLQALTAELKAVNEALWQVEDDIRICERNRDFGPRFIELARSVYRHNDRRAALKRQINELLGSKLVEEKGYTP